MMSNKRKAELLIILRKEIHQCMVAIAECDTDEELKFLTFERNRLFAELDYSIDYYEEHMKDDTK